jgi:hypothetical protein
MGERKAFSEMGAERSTPSISRVSTFLPLSNCIRQSFAPQ